MEYYRSSSDKEANKSSTDHFSDHEKLKSIDEIMDQDQESEEKNNRKGKNTQKAIEKRREKKRAQKMQKTKDNDSTKLPSDESVESVEPQKRKGTIWKILFPNMTFDEKNIELEKLVCKQVEHHISKDPNVIKIYQELKSFEESEESKQMPKGEYVKKKNRISAQLSRERREAILHSLINVCIENIKEKQSLDSDIQEVKQVLKDTLCGNCCSKLKGAQLVENQKPSTTHKKAAGGNLTLNRRGNSAITISRPGTWGIFMSIAVIACVLSVAFFDINGGPAAIGGVPATQGQAKRRFLAAEATAFDKYMEENFVEEPDTLPDVYNIGDLIRWELTTCSITRVNYIKYIRLLSEYRSLRSLLLIFNYLSHNIL